MPDIDSSKANIISSFPNPKLEDFKILGRVIKPTVSSRNMYDMLFSEAEDNLLSTADIKKVVEVFIPADGYDGHYYVGYVDSVTAITETPRLRSEMHILKHMDRADSRKAGYVGPISLDEYRSRWDDPKSLTDITIFNPFFTPNTSPYKLGNKMRYIVLQAERSKDFKRPS